MTDSRVECDRCGKQTGIKKLKRHQESETCKRDAINLKLAADLNLKLAHSSTTIPESTEQKQNSKHHNNEDIKSHKELVEGAEIHYEQQNLEEEYEEDLEEEDEEQDEEDEAGGESKSEADLERADAKLSAASAPGALPTDPRGTWDHVGFHPADKPKRTRSSRRDSLMRIRFNSEWYPCDCYTHAVLSLLTLQLPTLSHHQFNLIYKVIRGD